MGELGERGRAPTLKANQADSCIDLRLDKPPISLTSGSLVVLRTLARDQGGAFCGVEGQKHTVVRPIESVVDVRLTLSPSTADDNTDQRRPSKRFGAAS